MLAEAGRDALAIIRYTRHWLHYGCIFHATLCVLAAAVQGLLHR